MTHSEAHAEEAVRIPYIENVELEGVWGPDEMRWCGCGEYTLEKWGARRSERVGLNDAGDEVWIYEYKHGPRCPICQDKEVKGERVAA